MPFFKSSDTMDRRLHIIFDKTLPILKAPKEVSADRGYYKSTADADLKALGVQSVCIPKIGRKSKDRETLENTIAFK